MHVPDGMWASIESQIPIQEEKPKYWMLFLIMVFAVPLLMYFNSDITIHSQITETQLSTEHNENVASNYSSPYSILNNSKSVSNGDEESREFTTLETETSILTKPNAGLDFRNAKDLIKDLTKELTLNVSIGSKRDNSLSPTTSLFTPSLDDKISNGASKLKNLDRNLNRLNKRKLKFVSNPFKSKFNANSSKSPNNTFQLIEESRIYKELDFMEPITLMAPLKNLNLLKLNGNEQTQSHYIKMKDYIHSMVGCPKFEKEILGIYFYTNMYAGLTKQSLVAKNQESIGLVTQRENTESPALSNSFSLGIGRKWKKGFFFESGINVDKIVNRFNFEDTNTKVNILIDTINTPTGQVIQVDTTYIVEVLNSISSRNVLTQLNIPLVIGYEFPITEKLNIAAKAGVLVNLASSNRGQLLSPAGPMSYTSSDDNLSIYRTNLSMSYIGGLDLVCNLSSKFSVYTGFSFNYYPGDFSLSTYAIKQTYFKYGLNAGLRYHL